MARRKKKRALWVVHEGRTTRLHSRWEVYTFLYLRDQGFKFRPQPKPPLPYVDRKGKARRYTPDFLVLDPNEGPYYIEIKPKRFYSRRVKHKIADAAERNGTKIVVWTEEELKARQIFKLYKPKEKGKLHDTAATKRRGKAQGARRRNT